MRVFVCVHCMCNEFLAIPEYRHVSTFAPHHYTITLQSRTPARMRVGL